MKTILSIAILFLNFGAVKAGIVEKTYYFSKYTLNAKGNYQTFNFKDTKLYGFPGEPLAPWQKVALMLPPGEAAVSFEIIREDEVSVPGKFLLCPAQYVQPLSKPDSGNFLINEKLYKKDEPYPAVATGKLMTQYLNGFAFALATFTPVRYNPAKRQLSYFSKVTVRIHTKMDTQSQEALSMCIKSDEKVNTAMYLAQNPEMAARYPLRKSPAVNYQYLIVSPSAFKNEFQPLINLYGAMGISARVVTTDSISATMTGYDLQEKIRNFIINQRQNHSIQYVLLAGNPPLVPARGFYCYVNSGGTPYTDSNIPADLYFSGLDGNYDANGNHIYAELADNADLLPEISVARFTVNDTVELHKMIRKSVAYLSNPVRGEFSRPLLAGEYLTGSPTTYGKDYMNLLINDHSDNGYFTNGIPSASNQIQTLYDSAAPPPVNIFQWSSSQLLAQINLGNSFIHHLGHASETSMLRLGISQITNANFSQVNGVIHNFQLLYTQGCYDGAFDLGCIAAKSVKIDNFLVAGIFNSRYGWFNQGTTDGPSQHLQREFVNALYNDSISEKHIGTAHLISKIRTAPWIGLPGEFEPGAQRWCHFCCNVFGDPALEIWTEEPSSFLEFTWTGASDSNWLNPANWSAGMVPGSVCNVTIPATPHNPVISASGNIVCNNLTIAGGGNLIINPGKSMLVYGTVTLAGE
ncbi:MAG: C25 family cysteine peptidase [Bacteroidetes bacterium]|nr:C25 family cysteine peptidase [Bacteroidota bacterium]